MNDAAASKEAVKVRERRGGSLTRRMILIAAAWISVLLLGGGVLLDRTLTGLVQQNFDDQLRLLINSMVVSAELDNRGEAVSYTHLTLPTIYSV